MRLNDAARDLIGKGADATLVTLNPDGSPQVSVVWVALQSTRGPGQAMRPYLSVTGSARIVEGGAPELLRELAQTLASPDVKFPPDGAPPGFRTRIRIDKVGGVGPWAS